MSQVTGGSKKTKTKTEDHAEKITNDQSAAETETLEGNDEIAKRKLNDACVEMTQLKDAVPQ